MEKHTRFAWAGGTFFPVVLLCQFYVLAGNRFWLYILLCHQSLYSCGVVIVFLVLAGNSFWCYVGTQCTIQLCGCVFFFVAGKLILYEFSCYIQIFFLFIGNFLLVHTRSFLKNIKNFLCKQKLVNNHSIPLTHDGRKITYLSD